MTSHSATMDNQINLLRAQIAATESQLQTLKSQLRDAEHRAESAHYLEQAYAGGFPPEWLEETLAALGQDGTHSTAGQSQRVRSEGSLQPPVTQRGRWPLGGDEYKRYGRQLIVSEVGLHGQMRLKAAKVLIVGMGGLGSPAAAYLAGAGVGTLGLMDGDTVEISNLHRQIVHTTPRVGMSKVDSAYEYLSSYAGTLNKLNLIWSDLEQAQSVDILRPPPVSPHTGDCSFNFRTV